MPQRLLNGSLLLWRAFRYPIALTFRLVIALPFDDPVLRLHLSDVQVRNVQTGVLKDVVLDLLIGRVIQQAGGVQAFQGELDTDRFARYLALGKFHHRLDVFSSPDFPEISSRPKSKFNNLYSPSNIKILLG